MPPLPSPHFRKCLSDFVFQGMVSTYAWISGGELPSQRLRSYTFGFATAVGFFAVWLATFTAPYFIHPESLNWGPKYGYIWAPSCFLSAYVPPFFVVCVCVCVFIGVVCVIV